jgi:pentatricopeptide repeat protein
MGSECAHKLFDEMRETTANTVLSWPAMLVGYWGIGDVFEAKKLFDEMPTRNSISWNAMISGFVKIGDLKSSRELVNEILENWICKVRS